jgi:hypothetical protein
MRFELRFLPALLAAGMALLALPNAILAQQPVSGVVVPAEQLPDAPRPNVAADSPDTSAQQPAAPEQTSSSQASSSQAPTSQAPASQDQSTQQPAPGSTPAQNPQPQTPPAQGNSGSQSSAQQPADKTQHEKAEEQIKEEEKQRVLGIVPTFNITYRSDAVSLTAAQKMELAFRSSIDPATFGIAFVVSGLHEALDDDTGFRWGIEGYGRRTGAAYLDAFDGTMIGNGILPAVLHQDPRYFRLGHGTFTHRFLYAVATSVICKHDNSGRWEPNYSNVAGNIISGAISNLYYPPSNTGVGLTISNGLIVTGEGTAGGVFQEFWPDISRKVLHRDPTHGLDAQARAQDAAEKQARKEAKMQQKQQQDSQ